MTQTTKYSRFLLEAFVIVVSILLAFGIDAWWDERRERIEETEILAGVHREFEEYRDVRRGLPLSTALKTGAMPGDQEWPARVHRVVDDPAVAQELLLDPEFRALFEVRYAFWTHTGVEYQAALEAAEEILALLEPRQ